MAAWASFTESETTMAQAHPDHTPPPGRDRKYFPIRLIPIVVPLSAVVLACGIYLLLGEVL